MKKKRIRIIIVIFFCLFLIMALYLINKEKKEQKELDRIRREKELIVEIKSHYNEFVKTNKNSLVYNTNKEEVGTIFADVELMLKEVDITKDTEFFELKDFDGYYIKYEDVTVIEELTEYDQRYKNYILFNENILTNDKTSFYDEYDNQIYSFNQSYSLPIVIKDTEKYGVEFNNRLLYVKSNDVKEVVKNNNTDKTNVSAVPVLNYHFFYDDQDAEETRKCNESLCLAKSRFKSHLDYMKDNDIYTLKMDEFENYIDGRIQLPKSVLITIDDGPSSKRGIELLDEYKMNATLFLITSWFDAETFYDGEYIELHSHSHDLHTPGVCPGGQGGGIKCLDREKLLNDLKSSREELNGTTAFCYPFYEFNQYSIEVLKEAGFTMGFAGAYGDSLAKVGVNKFNIPRIVISRTTTSNSIDYYFRKIKS